ncbi:hypothetical protein BsWGS_02261 [Bradybaena similaris]
MCALREQDHNVDLKAHSSPSIDRMCQLGLTMGARRRERYTSGTGGSGTVKNQLAQLVSGRCESDCRGDQRIYGHVQSGVMVILHFELFFFKSIINEEVSDVIKRTKKGQKAGANEIVAEKLEVHG